MSRIQRIRESLDYSKARRRLDSAQVPLVLSWADSALWGTQAYLEEYGRSKAPAALEEARKGAITLLAAIDSALDRSS